MLPILTRTREKYSLFSLSPRAEIRSGAVIITSFTQRVGTPSILTTRRTESTLASVDLRHATRALSQPLSASRSLTALVIDHRISSRHAHPSSLPCSWYISKLLACPRMPVAAFHNSIHSNRMLAACKKRRHCCRTSHAHHNALNHATSITTICCIGRVRLFGPTPTHPT